MNCSSEFLVTADRKMDCLVVAKANLEHNHPTEKENFLRYPEIRRIEKEHEDLGRKMIEMSVPPSVFHETLLKVSGKMLTRRDVNNFKEKLKKQATGKNSEIEVLMESLDDILQQEPGSYVQLAVDEDGKISSLFIQLPFMKKALEKFPEVILFDATYRVNCSKMPLFTLIVEDGHGCSVPVAHFFVAGESRETLDHGFTALEKSVGKEILKKNHVFVVDKDFSEIALIKKFFPQSTIHLCLFHVLKTFRKETSFFARKVLKNKNEIMGLLEKIIYADTEIHYNKYYEELKVLATSNFLQYYTKNWHNCRHMWVSAWRKKNITFGNRTTNRLESFHQKLKFTMKSSNSLATCVTVLVRFSSQKALDTMHRHFLSYSAISYHATKMTETTNHVYQTCTPFAAKLVTDSLTSMKKLLGVYSCEKITEGYSIRHVSRGEGSYTVNNNMDSCSCTFSSTMMLPCKHIFFARSQSCDSSIQIFDKALVASRWRKEYQLFVADGKDITTGGTELLKPVKVMIKSSSNRILNRCEKYNKAFQLCRDISSAMAEHGQAMFNQYLSELTKVKDAITSGQEFVIADIVKEGTPTLAMEGQSSADVGVSKSNEYIIPTRPTADETIVEIHPQNLTKNDSIIRCHEFVTADIVNEEETPSAMEMQSSELTNDVNKPNDFTSACPIDLRISRETDTLFHAQTIQVESQVDQMHEQSVVAKVSPESTQHIIDNPDTSAITSCQISSNTSEARKQSNSHNVDFASLQLPDLEFIPSFPENNLKVVSSFPDENNNTSKPPVPLCTQSNSFKELLKGQPKIHLPIKVKSRGRPKGSSQSVSGLPKKSDQKKSMVVKTKRKKKSNSLGKPSKVTKITQLEKHQKFREQCTNLSTEDLYLLYDKCQEISCTSDFQNITDQIDSEEPGSYTLLTSIKNDVFELTPQLLSFFKDPGRDNLDVHMVLTTVILRAFEMEINPFIMLETLKEMPSHMTDASTFIQKAQNYMSYGDTNLNIFVGNNSLKTEDLKTLHPAQWLNDQVIHAYLDVLAREVNAVKPNSVYVLPSFLAVKWESGDCTSWLYKNIALEEYRWILLPICTSGHWFLIVADTTFGCIGVLNSLNWDGKRYEIYLDFWRLFMEARGSDGDWAVASYRCNKQDDGNSCGVFVLMNAEALVKDVPPVVMRQFHCDRYRMYILGRLLQHAKTNEEIICDFPFCDKPSGQSIPWTQCDNCNRWMHNQCANLPKAQTNSSYKCVFCVT